MGPRTSVIWDDVFTAYDFGPGHPMGPVRLDLTTRLARSLGVLDLSQQALTTTVASSAIAAGERDVQDGRRFFFTGRGRWSNSGWSDCASCHPDGLSDNITWSFAAGPRQSTSLDGAFTHGPGPQRQRVFNWTGIFDEMHDFERNTRGVSGGKPSGGAEG